MTGMSNSHQELLYTILRIYIGSRKKTL